MVTAEILLVWITEEEAWGQIQRNHKMLMDNMSFYCDKADRPAHRSMEITSTTSAPANEH